MAQSIRLTLRFANLVLISLSIVAASSTQTLSQWLQPEHKVPIDIDSSFSNQSNLTVVVTSCNRFKLLQLTLNSFFRYNTYVLRQFIIIDDCGGKQKQIWDLLPQGAKSKTQLFKIIINKKKLGQIGSIDRAYAEVSTKYVYHLEDDWLQVSGYGFIQHLVAVLQYGDKQGLNISQVVQTFPQWQWTHKPSMLYRTRTGTRFYLLYSYGKDYVYSFSFNPHLLNYDKVYSGIFNKSYAQSVARRYHCIQQNQQIYQLTKGGCVEHETGRHLQKLGYRQVFCQIGKKSMYKHLGAQGYVHNVTAINLQMSIVRPQNDKSNQNLHQQAQNQLVSNTNSAEDRQKSLIDELSYEIVIVAIAMFALLGIHLLRNSCMGKTKIKPMLKNDKSNQQNKSRKKTKIVVYSDDDYLQEEENESQLRQQQSSLSDDEQEKGSFQAHKKEQKELQE